MRRIVPFLALAVFLLKTPPGEASPTVVNPSFEEGESGWSWRTGHAGWNPFLVSSKRAHSGRYAALTRLEKKPGLPGSHIWGVLQGFELTSLPRRFGVWYRVEDWKQGVEKQYVQVVVMIHDRRLERLMIEPHMQVRYILAGLSGPPHAEPANGRYVMAGPKEPRRGRWIHFETDLIRDFIKTWGWYPENFQRMEVFLEARYDEPAPEDSKISGEVFWDDVSLTED